MIPGLNRDEIFFLMNAKSQERLQGETRGRKKKEKSGYTKQTNER